MATDKLDTKTKIASRYKDNTSFCCVLPLKEINMAFFVMKTYDGHFGKFDEEKLTLTYDWVIIVSKNVSSALRHLELKFCLIHLR